MCENDYQKISSVHDRMTRALTQIRDGGGPRDVAVAFVALSEGESAAVWAQSRPLPDDDDCCGQVIGIESGYYAPLGDDIFNHYVGRDSLALEWLRERGWIGWDAQTQRVRPAGAIVPPGNQRERMLFFEFLVANQRWETLQTISIGPTQIWLGNGAVCETALPRNLEELWFMYSTADPWSMITLHLGYLLPKRYSKDGCLSHASLMPDGTEQTAVNWLAKHAGSTSRARDVYNGAAWLGNRRPYKEVWAEANMIAETVY